MPQCPKIRTLNREKALTTLKTIITTLTITTTPPRTKSHLQCPTGGKRNHLILTFNFRGRWSRAVLWELITYLNFDVIPLSITLHIIGQVYLDWILTVTLRHLSRIQRRCRGYVPSVL